MKRVIILVLALSLASTSAVVSKEKDDGAILYRVSVGAGASLPQAPDEFDAGWNPSFGLLLDVAAAKSFVELSADFDYSFFLSDAQTPDDANILTAFLNLKIKPLKSTVRPYVFAGAGYFRYWIVDLNIYENVLGFGGGGGVEIEIGKTRSIFVEGKSVQGRTRETANRANTEIIPIRMGITFTF